eukprot:6394266-Heterocapsa_arctica.AAC.1
MILWTPESKFRNANCATPANIFQEVHPRITLPLEAGCVNAVNAWCRGPRGVGDNTSVTWHVRGCRPYT